LYKGVVILSLDLVQLYSPESTVVRFGESAALLSTDLKLVSQSSAEVTSTYSHQSSHTTLQYLVSKSSAEVTNTYSHQSASHNPTISPPVQVTKTHTVSQQTYSPGRGGGAYCCARGSPDATALRTPRPSSCRLPRCCRPPCRALTRH